MPDEQLRTPVPVRLPITVVVLTTETPHHLYFLRELRRRCADIISLDLVLMEDRPFPYRRLFFRHLRRRWINPVQGLLLNPYLHIPYRAGEQLQYELENFFPNGDFGYDEGMRVETVPSVNTQLARSLLKEVESDVMLVYGTGLVRPSVFELPRITTVNFHGGFLPNYRGSDTNIWAILNDECDKMSVALHKMDATFDTGPVYMMERMEPKADMSLVTLRYYTTLLATDMGSRLLKQIATGGASATPQPPDSGRNYSFVPRVLKTRADRKLQAFVRSSVQSHGS